MSATRPTKGFFFADWPEPGIKVGDCAVRYVRHYPDGIGAEREVTFPSTVMPLSAKVSLPDPGCYVTSVVIYPVLPDEHEVDDGMEEKGPLRGDKCFDYFYVDVSFTPFNNKIWKSTARITNRDSVRCAKWEPAVVTEAELDRVVWGNAAEYKELRAAYALKPVLSRELTVRPAKGEDGTEYIVIEHKDGLFLSVPNVNGTHALSAIVVETY